MQWITLLYTSGKLQATEWGTCWHRPLLDCSNFKGDYFMIQNFNGFHTTYFVVQPILKAFFYWAKVYVWLVKFFSWVILVMHCFGNCKQISTVHKLKCWIIIGEGWRAWESYQEGWFCHSSGQGCSWLFKAKGRSTYWQSKCQINLILVRSKVSELRFPGVSKICLLVSYNFFVKI